MRRYRVVVLSGIVFPTYEGHAELVCTVAVSDIEVAESTEEVSLAESTGLDSGEVGLATEVLDDEVAIGHLLIHEAEDIAEGVFITGVLECSESVEATATTPYDIAGSSLLIHEVTAKHIVTVCQIVVNGVDSVHSLLVAGEVGGCRGAAFGLYVEEVTAGAERKASYKRHTNNVFVHIDISFR